MVDEESNQERTKSLIGIAVAIGGNILISLALNCQKLAHKRLDIEKRDQASAAASERSSNNGTPNAPANGGESRPLLRDNGSYDPYTTPRRPSTRTTPSNSYDSHRHPSSSTNIGRPFRAVEEDEVDRDAVTIEITPEHVAVTKHDDRTEEEKEEVRGNESDYLRSKLWCVSLSLSSWSSLRNIPGGLAFV